jgi:hypothetical protein
MGIHDTAAASPRSLRLPPSRASPGSPGRLGLVDRCGSQASAKILRRGGHERRDIGFSERVVT